MARIRSLHPGQATDEDYVSMSPMARLATLHIRCEADDNGVFEWKPLMLKMRLFPADDVDMAAILKEMQDCRQVTKFTVDGRDYGAIRNFAKWQRPRRPAPVHPIPDNVRTYVGLEGSTPDNVRHEHDNDGKVSADVGGRRKEEGDSPPSEAAEPPSPDKVLFDLGYAVLGKGTGGQVTKLKVAFGVEGAHRHLMTAKTKAKPMEYVVGILRNHARDGPGAHYDPNSDPEMRGVI